MELKERFLKYVGFDTQSDPESETFPSTAHQLVLLNHLCEEMGSIGLTDIEIDANGYVSGTIPATPGYESKPVIGFISHVDTSPDMKGSDIRPRIVENYDGEDIALNDTLTMRVADFPELSLFKGHTLVTTDGTTLLGADDKAGIAEIMTAAEHLIAHPEIAHGKIRIGFTPDEEIGRGVDFFDVERFGAKFAVCSKDPDEKEIAELVKCADGAENIIFSSCNAHLFRGQLALAAALAEKGVPMTVAALRNPYDLPLMPENAALLAAFDYSRDSLAALADVFSGGDCCGVMPAAL